MSKLKIFSGVFIIGVLIGAYLVFSDNSQQQKKDSTQKDITFSEFIKKDGSYKCTVSRPIEPGLPGSARLNGVAYIGNSMIRVDYPNALSLIFKNGITYWWWVKGNPNYGNAVGGEYLQESKTGTYSWKSEDIIEYDCENWRLDSSKFEFPSNLKRYEQVPVVKQVPAI